MEVPRCESVSAGRDTTVIAVYSLALVGFITVMTRENEFLPRKYWSIGA